jgi:adenosylhomocysteine nucleosidase
MSGKILILTAVDDELDKAGTPEGFEVIYTGVGKVNASSGATLALLVLRPTLVINYGTAGKINDKLAGLVEVAEVVQRDMMAMPLAPRGRTPFSPNLDRLSSGHGNVICGTGDSLVTAAQDPWLAENGIDIVDMELFAIAHVCQRHSVPWRAFKYLTDAFAAEYRSADATEGQNLFWDAMRKLKDAG